MAGWSAKMRQLKRWRSLDDCERKLLLEALVALGRVRMTLWLRPSSAAFRDYPGRTSSGLQVVDADSSDPAQVALAVRRAGKVIPASTCLAQALATQMMLARRGITVEVRIGVARDEHRSFEAHAWVELGGRVLIGNLHDLDRFEPFPRFSQGG